MVRESRSAGAETCNRAFPALEYVDSTRGAAVSGPFISFLSDYGLDDDFVGICHGVIATICPEARVIDIAHGVRRHDVRAGAVILRDALAYMPAGVHLAIVDPDVGAERRAVALRLDDDRLLVGPDNGLLWPAAELGGGVVEAADIARSRFRLEPLSATFHGRDIFAPVAARLAAGAPLAEAGEPCDPANSSSSSYHERGSRTAAWWPTRCMSTRTATSRSTSTTTTSPAWG